jgi:hypothetical protein
MANLLCEQLSQGQIYAHLSIHWVGLVDFTSEIPARQGKGVGV